MKKGLITFSTCIQVFLVACIQVFVVACATANADKPKENGVVETVVKVDNATEVTVGDDAAEADSKNENDSIDVATQNVAGKEQENTSASKEDTFSQLLTSVSTLEGSFTQILKGVENETLQQTEGRFTIMRPGYFYWEVNPPYQQIVVGTPESLHIYDPDLEQMTVQKSASLSGTPAAFMSGDSSEIFESYTMKETRKEKIIDFTFTLKQNADASFSKIQFVFDRTPISGSSNPVLSYLSFEDKLGQTTSVQLKNVVVNQEVKKSTFEFVPPEGTDIIIDG